MMENRSESMHDRYPHLFNDMLWPWGPVQVKFQILDHLPPLKLIAHVNLTPYLDNKWVVIQLADGRSEIPGGTLEPDELYLDAIKRELMEEVGAKLVSFGFLGAWHCRSLAERLFRPHLPHPEFYRVVLIGQVSLDGTPKFTTSSESVIDVQAVPIEVIVDRFNKQGRPELAELYLLAEEMVKEGNLPMPINSSKMK
jgi:8-oxo-dGTP diphosphatase